MDTSNATEMTDGELGWFCPHCCNFHDDTDDANRQCREGLIEYTRQLLARAMQDVESVPTEKIGELWRTLLGEYADLKFCDELDDQLEYSRRRDEIVRRFIREIGQLDWRTRGKAGLS
jgi:hypothetical protein